MMISLNKIEDARRLLKELKTILEYEGDSNSVQGVIAAHEALGSANFQQGFAEARAIYRTAAQAKAPLSEYYIKRSDATEQRDANQRLDDIRDELWRLFE